MPMMLDIDSQCGRYFTYRDLIECGETWFAYVQAGAPIDNLPRNASTLRALEQLCGTVLDPLAEVMGRPKLTYGFASPRLCAKIPARLAPRLDQHTACEVKRDGTPVELAS